MIKPSEGVLKFVNLSGEINYIYVHQSFKVMILLNLSLDLIICIKKEALLLPFNFYCFGNCLSIICFPCYTIYVMPLKTLF